MTIQKVTGGVLRRIAVVTCVAGSAVAATSAHATTLTSKNCGTVAANGGCSTASISTGQTRCTLFRLTNGSGVNHRAQLFDVVREGTAMDIYSPQVSYSGSLAGGGVNLSSSPHNYMIYQVTC